MKNIDFAYLIPMTLSLLSFIIYVIVGKKDYSKSVWKYFPLFSVISMIVGVYVLTSYYENQLEIEKQNFQLLQKNRKINERVFLNDNFKKATIDSLKKVNLELERLLRDIKKQEKIVGQTSNLNENIKQKIEITNGQIGLIESYNEIVEIPKFILKGHTGIETSNFIFVCPREQNDSFLDLKLSFQDEKLIDKIACLYLEVTEKKENGQSWLLFRQAYSPKKGMNAIKIKNYLNRNNITLEVGYFLKSQMNKEYPDFNRITCN